MYAIMIMIMIGTLITSFQHVDYSDHLCDSLDKRREGGELELDSILLSLH